MTNRRTRREQRLSPLGGDAERRRRNAGRRLVVVLAVAALVALSVASFGSVGTANPAPSESAAPSAS
ncbi:MAG: hypothetical protein RL338_1442 [Chloroflexota bacterium]|jgi:hypothetical protein